MCAYRRIVAVLILGSVASAATLSAPAPARAVEADEKAAKSAGQDTANSPPLDASPHRPVVRIAGRVVDEAGRPAPGATVEAGAYHNQIRAVAGDDGAFTLDVGRDPPRRIIATTDDGRQAYHFSRDYRRASPPIELTLRPPREIEVRVVDAEGAPVSGAAVSAVLYFDQQLAKVTSDATGKALLRVPADAPLAHLLAKKDGAGFDYLTFARPDQPLPEVVQPQAPLPSDSQGPFTLTLNGVRSTAVRVVDEAGRPLSNVNVRLNALSLPRKPPLNLHGIDDFDTITGDDGRTSFPALPKDSGSPLAIGATSAKMAWLESSVANAGDGGGAVEITITMTPRIELAGQVTLPNGRPAPGAEVTFTGAGSGRGVVAESLLTDAEGNFSFFGLPDYYYLVVASLGSRVSAAVTRVARRARTVDRMNLTLQDGTRLHGRIAIGPRDRSLAHTLTALCQDPDIAHADLPEADRLALPNSTTGIVQPRLMRYAFTDADGNYEFLVGPGHYQLIAPAQADSPKFVIAGEREMEIDLHSERADRIPLIGRVVLQGDPATIVARAEVRGMPLEARSFPFATRCDKVGAFEIERAPGKMLVCARSNDQLLCGIALIDADDEGCEIAVAQACSVRGRLVTPAGDEPLANRPISYGIRIERAGRGASSSFGGTTTTDEQGEFKVVGLVPGWKYEIATVEAGPPRVSRIIASVQAAEGGEIDLGDVAAPD